MELLKKIFKKGNLKLIIPLFCLIVISIIVVILCFKKPKMLSITTLHSPLNSICEIKEDDSLTIRIYVNQKNSYYTDIEKITSASISDNDTLYKLKVNSITKADETSTLYNQEYYLYYYNFSFDFKFLSNYEDNLDNAKLNLEFSNGVNSNLEVGSLTIIRYANEETNKISDIAITQSKTINHNNNENGFYGIILGIRNFNTEKEVNITSIEVLETTIKDMDIMKEVSELSSDINSVYPTYPTIDSFPSKITINKKDLKYIAIPIIQEHSNDINSGSFGLRITYEINENGVITTKTYYLTKFVFYDYLYTVKEDKLKFYEYEYK